MSSRVLVVDDDPVVRVLTTEFLTKQGYEVQALESGTAFLKQLDSNSAPIPDIVVLDMMMPDMTGVQVLSELKEKHKSTRVPVVLMSSDTDVESIAQTWNVQADRYVKKPFGMNDILQVLKGLGM